MIRLQHMIGLPVIEIEAGKQVGHVKDAWFDEHWRIDGIILETGRRFLSSVKSVLWSDVLVCGDDAVLVANERSVRKAEAGEVMRTFHSGDNCLKDLPLVTDRGEQLGRLSDVYFDDSLGTQIIGFEVTDGFIADLMEGRKWLPAPLDSDSVFLGEHAIIVPAGTESLLESIAVSESDIGRNEP